MAQLIVVRDRRYDLTAAGTPASVWLWQRGLASLFLCTVVARYCVQL